MSAAQHAGRWGLVKTAGVGFAGGVLIWAAADVVGELTTFIKLRDRGLYLASQNQELIDQIGGPFSPGPWYNSRIGFAPGGSQAQCTFQLQGTRQITDVTVRGMRPPTSYVHKALYNLLGPGAWTIVDCTAMFPAGGGMVQPRSLLPKTQPGAAQQQQQQQQGSSSSDANNADSSSLQSAGSNSVSSSSKHASSSAMTGTAAPPAPAAATTGSGSTSSSGRSWWRLSSWRKISNQEQTAQQQNSQQPGQVQQ